jgi:glucose-6-phosphate 1-dehydrogenase
MNTNEAQPISIIIIGASGDLTQRKLIPALFHLYLKGRLPRHFNIIGLSRTPYPHDQFRAHLREGLTSNGSPQEWEAFAEHISYVAGNSQQPDAYTHLQAMLQEVEGGHSANRIYYFATAPDLFPIIAGHLGDAGMADERDGGWRRVVVEKPYGEDLHSARELDRVMHSAFREGQIYRIDHYLGKETAQNILFFRFANTIFEPVWNRNYIDSVHIAVEESVDIGRRGAYFDQAGILRDMFQNHLLQLLSLIAMEPPASFRADAVRNEKVKVLSAIPPIPLSQTFRAQYAGYRQAKGVADESQTATYAALKLSIDNWRWKGVPFYLSSGKALARRTSEIRILFQCPPHVIFEMPPFNPNQLTIIIQPDEGIHLQFEVKEPGSAQQTRSVDMEFHYKSYYGETPLPDAYERLLLDVIIGDASLFPRNDAIEVAWRLIDPIIAGWQHAPDAPPLISYEPGSTAPDGVSAFLGHACRCRPGGCQREEPDET